MAILARTVLDMLSEDQKTELRHFLNRLQTQEVRAEICSRLNNGFRLSLKGILETNADVYTIISESGEMSIFIDPNEAEAFSSDASSVTLLYGDDLVTVRFARKR